MSITLEQETYLPATGEGERLLRDFAGFLAKHDTDDVSSHPSYYLAGASTDDRVELPEEVYRVLRQVVEAMQQGLAVTVAPRSLMLTTQQAADLLGVSRPTLVKLLDEQRIPYQRTGTHRRVRLRDVLAYREQRRAEQYAVLEATAVSLDDEGDLEATLLELRETRRAVAAQRRTRTTPA